MASAVVDPNDEIKTLKSILRRYEKQIDELSNRQDQDKQLIEIKNLRNELQTVKKKNKDVLLQRDQFERDLIKRAKIIASLEEKVSTYKQREVVSRTEQSGESQSAEQQKFDALEKKMGLEIKNLKHEANALRAQTHANEQTIKSLQFQLEDLNHKLKEKDRIIASFAIWKKSIVYTRNKSMSDMERNEKIKAALPVPILSLINHRTDTSTTIKVKINELKKVEHVLKIMKEKDGYKPDEAMHLEDKDLVVCLEAKSGDVRLEMPAVKDGEYEFEMNDLEVGKIYQLECYVKDKKSGMAGSGILIDVVSDVLPSIPNPVVKYDSSAGGIKFQLSKTKTTVKSFNIYLLDRESNTVDLLQTIYASSETQEFLYAPEKEGFYAFQVSQVNDIGEGKMCSPLILNIHYPTKPELDLVARDSKNDILIQVKCHPSNTNSVQFECKDLKLNESVECETELVTYKLKQTAPKQTITIRSVSSAGQISEPIKVTFSLHDLSPHPSPPEFNIKSPTSLLVFPTKSDDCSKVTAIQVRFEVNGRVYDHPPSSAISGYQSMSLASAISLPPSNYSLSGNQSRNGGGGDLKSMTTLDRKLKKATFKGSTAKLGKNGGYPSGSGSRMFSPVNSSKRLPVGGSSEASIAPKKGSIVKSKPKGHAAHNKDDLKPKKGIKK